MRIRNPLYKAFGIRDLLVDYTETLLGIRLSLRWPGRIVSFLECAVRTNMNSI